MFVTLALGILDLGTGELDFASGGHEETFLLPASGGVENLSRTGPALGLFEGAQFGSRRVAVGPGDTVVFATDGVTEAFDPARAMYGRPARRAARARPGVAPGRARGRSRGGRRALRRRRAAVGRHNGARGGVQGRGRQVMVSRFRPASRS